MLSRLYFLFTYILYFVLVQSRHNEYIVMPDLIKERYGDEIGFIANKFYSTEILDENITRVYAKHYVSYPHSKSTLVLEFKAVTEEGEEGKLEVTNNPFNLDETLVDTIQSLVMDDNLEEFIPMLKRGIEKI